jgi:E3 ubiquitin-protein ligase RNF14
VAEADAEAAAVALVRGRLAAAAPLTRATSSSRAADLRHLPPLRLTIELPAAYPDVPLEFALDALWVSPTLLDSLCASADSIVRDSLGEAIIFLMVSELKQQCEDVLSSGAAVELGLDEPSDPRASRSSSGDVLQDLRRLVAYDQERSEKLWSLQTHLCQVCFTEKSGNDFVKLGCGHDYCRACTAEQVRVAVSSSALVELKCPLPDCRADISHLVVEKVVDEDTFERYFGLLIQDVLKSELRVAPCPRCAEYEKETPVLLTDDDPPLGKCTVCEFIFCGKCAGVYHPNRPCLSEDEQAWQSVSRRLQVTGANGQMGDSARRRTKVHLPEGADSPELDEKHVVQRSDERFCEGDKVISVRCDKEELWPNNGAESLEWILHSRRPLDVTLRCGNTPAHMRTVMQELMTLRAIAQNSMKCPKCQVQISRSEGCNHMTCTNCATHFCYQCGKTISSTAPYEHFKYSNCTTFDAGEVQRVQVQERNNPDQELARLRALYGDQGALFNAFAGEARRGPDIQRRLDIRCPICGAWNARVGQNNHCRCQHCRGSFCHQCKKPIKGVVTAHFGPGKCSQHGDA